MTFIYNQPLRVPYINITTYIENDTGKLLVRVLYEFLSWVSNMKDAISIHMPLRGIGHELCPYHYNPNLSEGPIRRPQLTCSAYE